MNSDKEITFEKVAVLLLDVAGTTTSSEYVKEKLFAFIVEESAAFLKKNAEDDTVKNALKELQETDKQLDTDTAVDLIKKLTNENSDKKSLKTLQGLISKDGFKNGTLKAHIFDDVKTAFESWSKDKKIAIYSTGDVETQKLLFSHTTEGNLSSFISNYFDQSVGLKTAPESYTKIVEELKIKYDEVLFISDDPSELTAAKKAGVLTALIKRTGNPEVAAELSKEFTTIISSFADVSFEPSNKRKIEDAVDGSEIPPTKIAKTDDEVTNVANEPTKVEESTAECVPEEKKKTESTSEPMEVDSTESELESPELKPEQVSTKALPMEAEEIKTATDKPNDVAPVKTDAENSTDKENKSEVDSTIVETETKTEKSNSVDETDKIGNLPTTNETEINSTQTKLNAENGTKEAPVSENVSDKKETTCVSEDTSEAAAKVSEDKVGKEEIVASTVKPAEEVKNKVTESNNMPSLVDLKPNDDSDNTPTTTDASIGSVTVTEATKVETKSNTNEAEVKAIKVQSPETKVEECAKESKDESKVEKCITEKVETETKENCKEDTVTNENIVDDTTETDATKTAQEGSNEKTKENGSTEGKQNGTVSSESKSTEEVSNGVVNGQENGDSSKNSSDGEKEESTDIKIKKLEKSVGSPAVAVEV